MKSGVLHPYDAKIIQDKYSDVISAIWISNHGGRQLDGGVGTGDALPHIMNILGTEPQKKPQIPVIIDGGITRGIDLLKGLLLGAQVVCVGRPILYALAADGEKGAELGLKILKDQLENSMALAGVQSCETIGESTKCLIHEQGREEFLLSKM